jgi:hypothetical protein
VTLALVGGTLVATTSVGCGPAQKLGLKGVLAHCKKTDPVAQVVPTPSATPAPSATPSAQATPTPTPTPSAPSSPVPVTTPDSGPVSGSFPPFQPPASAGITVPGLHLTCRLPVYVGPPGSGGFIVFPGATFIGDPRSAVTLPSPSPGSTPTPSPPGYGPGYTGLSYDRAYSRWLPVPYAFVTPDGSRYAHTSPDSMYVENVATGTTIELGEGHAWTIIAVEAEGVYATIVNQAGLWLLPYSGAAKQITKAGYWQMAAAGAAYGGTASAVPSGVANTIIRLDLKTGAVTDWFRRGGAQSFMFGFDAHGNALISVNYFVSGGGNEMWITTSLKDRVPMFGSRQQLSATGQPIADSHGIWFPLYFNGYGASTPGVGLYVAGKGLYWMTSIGSNLAGGCA